MFQWQPVSETLMMREDEFSWQGAHPSDPRVFLRRSKDHPEQLTDMLFGHLSPVAAARVLERFLAETGGLGSRLVITSFKSQGDGRDEVVARYDVLTEVVRAAAGGLKTKVSNTILRPNRGYWDAVLDFATSSE